MDYDAHSLQPSYAHTKCEPPTYVPSYWDSGREIARQIAASSFLARPLYIWYIIVPCYRAS